MTPWRARRLSLHCQNLVVRVQVLLRAYQRCRPPGSIRQAYRFLADTWSQLLNPTPFTSTAPQLVGAILWAFSPISARTNSSISPINTSTRPQTIVTATNPYRFRRSFLPTRSAKNDLLAIVHAAAVQVAATGYEHIIHRFLPKGITRALTSPTSVIRTTIPHPFSCAPTTCASISAILGM